METEIVNLVEAFKHIPKLMELNLGIYRLYMEIYHAYRV